MRKRMRETTNESAVTRLRAAGLRPTRQRNELADLLFRDGHRHLTAETLHADAVSKGIRVSLATVYNTLHQFTNSRLLRQVMVDSTRSYFDTNTTEHQHFYYEEDGMLADIPGSEEIAVGNIPEAPEGTKVARVDVVVRLTRF
ncbi:MAG: Fur family transcriptional regulator [Rhizomicrobium sp.]|nr:Fur family transcriptional regulator [Rhizomicrobium sp.]